MRAREDSKAHVLVGCSFLALFAAWTIFPIAVMAYTALSAVGIATGSAQYHLGLDNFRQVLSDPSNSFTRSLGTSVALATVVSLASLALGLPASYALARRKGKAVKLIGEWILGTRFLPPIIPAILLFVMYRAVGLLNSSWAVVVSDILIALPFVIWVSRSYIGDLPESLEELAELDGMSPRQRLVRVVVPSLQGPLLAVTSMTWLLIWNEYLFALLFGGTIRPLTVLIASWNTYQGVLWGPACAAGLMALLPAVLLLLLSLRLLIRGFMFGMRINS